MNEQNKEKLIAHLEKGTEIFLVLNDDTGIIGVVERNVLCWEETDGNWHELTVYVGGQHITINSNNIKEVRKCILHTEDEHNQIIGRDAFEIYNVPYGLADVDFIKTVLDSWDGLEDDAKEEITDVIAPSLTSAMLKDIFGAYLEFLRLLLLPLQRSQILRNQQFLQIKVEMEYLELVMWLLLMENITMTLGEKDLPEVYILVSRTVL